MDSENKIVCECVGRVANKEGPGGPGSQCYRDKTETAEQASVFKGGDGQGDDLQWQ